MTQAQQPVAAVEQLGRFDHHPETDIDFLIEAEELESVLENEWLGHVGQGREAEYEALPARLGAFLDFATIDQVKRDAKDAVRTKARRNGFILGEAAYAGFPVQRNEVLRHAAV